MGRNALAHTAGGDASSTCLQGKFLKEEPNLVEGMKSSEKSGAEVGESDDQNRVASELTEDLALAELQRADISASEIAMLAKSSAAAKSRKVALAVVRHARTPRHVSIPLLRRMFTFDLMQVTLTPAMAADIKRAAEEQILARAESLSLGEKISLAKRASGRVAAAFLQDPERRVIAPALDNTRLTESLIVQALMKPGAPAELFERVSGHRSWAQRREVQIALLRSEKTPLERAQEFARNFSAEVLGEIVPEGRVGLLRNDGG
jgi:hypothetical protein